MRPDSYFDVIILGAGPAGSTAAKLLSEGGLQVALLDKAKFPRHKTCAAWINRLVFEEFPYFQSRLDQLVDTPFFGIRFFNRDLSRNKTAHERRPSGYLTLRSKIDNGLKDLAVEAGAQFFEELSIQSFIASGEDLEVVTSKETCLGTKILIGADGVNSRVAELAGLRHGWKPEQVCLCANEDLPYDAHALRKFYGERFPINVMIQFDDIEGYGWLFPKKNHICIGLGARLKREGDIRALYRKFLEKLKLEGMIPRELKSEDVSFAVDPAGAVYHSTSLVHGRILLIGDAAGFVSGSTGEGIYPAMLSARVAARIISQALREKDPGKHLKDFDLAWRSELGSYIKSFPGGGTRASTVRRIHWIFKNKWVCHIAAKMFL